MDENKKMTIQLKEKTIKKIVGLAKKLQESEATIIERSIDQLYDCVESILDPIKEIINKLDRTYTPKEERNNEINN